MMISSVLEFSEQGKGLGARIGLAQDATNFHETVQQALVSVVNQGVSAFGNADRTHVLALVVRAPCLGRALDAVMMRLESTDFQSLDLDPLQ
jgi:hypothetical protein